MSFITSSSEIKKRQRHRFLSIAFFEFSHFIDETFSSTDVSSRKKTKRKAYEKKKKRNFITFRQKKKTRETRRLNKKLKNNDHVLMKR